MTRSGTTALALGAFVASLVALLFALTTVPSPGVEVDGPTLVVTWVDPTGPGWDLRIRTGDRIVHATPGAEPGGAVLEFMNGERVPTVFREAIYVGELRATAVPVVLGALLAVLALVAAGTRRRRSELLASTALALASIPYVVYQNVPVGSVILAAGGIAPVVWLVRWGPGRIWPVRIAAIGAIGLAIAWAAIRASRVEAAIPVGQAGSIALVVAAVLMLAIGTGLTPGRVLRVIATTRALDLAVVAGAVLAVVGLAIAGVPLPLIALVVLLPLLAYAKARAGIASLVERTLMADMRERESIRATEDERARMSREIHDDPLQALAGVIRRLEQPDADVAGARDSLRDVADRLRSVATELHPPVLDDLGLAPAIDAGARLLAQGAGPDAPEIEVRIANQAGYTRAERAPADVELAVYRITQEAMENAVRHAGAGRVTVRGTIAATRIDVEIEDDGRGISDAAMDTALRSGHLGITSMRRRADAIDARLDIDGAPGSGTRVRLRWSA